MASTENSLLVEKYRPSKLENYVGNENIKKSISKYLDQNDIQNLIFYGPAGTGKTTLAKLCIQNLDCDHLYINASDERGIETIRDKVQGFASVASFKPLKVVILDEADFLTIQAQASLRNIIETFSRTTRFIMTCNFVERIIDPLQSRCQVLKIVPPTKKDVAKHLNWILQQESIEHDINDLEIECKDDAGLFSQKVQVLSARRKRLYEDYEKDEKWKLDDLIKEFSRNFHITKDEAGLEMEEFDGTLTELYDYISTHSKYKLKSEKTPRVTFKKRGRPKKIAV